MPFLRDTPVIDGVPLKTSAMFAGAATRTLGSLIGDDRLIAAAADHVGEVLVCPL